MTPCEAQVVWCWTAVGGFRFSIDCLTHHKIKPSEYNGLKQRYSEPGQLDMLHISCGPTDQDTACVRNLKLVWLPVPSLKHVR